MWKSNLLEPCFLLIESNAAAVKLRLGPTSYLVVPHSALSPEEETKEELVIFFCLYVAQYAESNQCPIPLKDFKSDRITAEDKINRAVLTPFKGQNQQTVIGPQGTQEAPLKRSQAVSWRWWNRSSCSVCRLWREGSICGDIEWCLHWFTEPFVVAFQQDRHRLIPHK